MPPGTSASMGVGHSGEPEGASDEELMRRVARLDPTAYTALYDRHCGAAFSLAHSILGDRGADQVVEEAFMSLWATASSYGPAHGTVRAWLLARVHARSAAVLRRLTEDEGQRR